LFGSRFYNDVAPTALRLAGAVLVCALTVQEAARNKIGMMCWIFIDVSIQGQPPVLRCYGETGLQFNGSMFQCPL